MDWNKKLKSFAVKINRKKIDGISSYPSSMIETWHVTCNFLNFLPNVGVHGPREKQGSTRVVDHIFLHTQTA